MTHEVRTVSLIATVIFLAAFVAYFLGLHPLVFLQFPVLLVMAWGISTRLTTVTPSGAKPIQNKIDWVLVQFIPVLGTVGYYILVHRALLEAEDRVPRR
jgi:hypothetical protein